MAIVSFWSNSHRQTGQTMSLVAIATSMARATTHFFHLTFDFSAMFTPYQKHLHQLVFVSINNYENS